VATDAAGELTFPVPGGAGTGDGATLYAQVVVRDAARPGAYTLSNAVHVRWPPEEDRYRVVAIRDDAYKLIRVIHDNESTLASYGPGTPTLFFDLASDPLEQDELLRQGPLTGEQQGAFDALDAALDALLASP